MVTEAQYEKAIAAINAAIDAKAIRLRPCPTCGSDEPAVLSEGYVLLALSTHGDRDGRDGRALPTLPFICQTCGHTTLLNAAVLGVSNDVFEEK
jgi:hypothetical protein